MDISPLPENQQTEDAYFETITFEDAGGLKNGQEQDIFMVRYLQIVRRMSDNGVFHDQCGYWMWDRQQHHHAVCRHPRGLTLVAGGRLEDGWSSEEGYTMSVAASAAANSEWAISQSPFLNAKAITTAYEADFSIRHNTLNYYQTTSLQIYGRDFDHTDGNILTRQD